MTEMTAADTTLAWCVISLVECELYIECSWSVYGNVKRVKLSTGSLSLVCVMDVVVGLVSHTDSASDAYLFEHCLVLLVERRPR